MMEVRKNTNESGYATLIALMAMALLTLIGLAALSISDDEVQIAGNQLQETRAFYAAESGLDVAVSALQREFDSTNAPPVNLPSGAMFINNCSTLFSTTAVGPAHASKIANGSMIGLNAYIKEFSVNATGVNVAERAKVEVSETFETQMIPIFQWAVYFNDDLWAQPVFDLIIEGRTHVNGDMFLQNTGSGYSTSFLDRVTCAGGIHNGLPSGTNNSGDVKFADPLGNLVSMNQGGSWIDSDRSDWYDQATALWGGLVQDESFGQDALNLPISNSADVHDIIERSPGNPESLQNRATFQVIDGVSFAKIGSVWQDVSAMLPAGTVVSDGSSDFYDAHEKKTVQNTTVDMDLLGQSAYFPPNGILYVSDHRGVSGSTLNGVSLVNGAELEAPLTVVSENPTYIHGDYNSINKQPASVITDAATFLSNNWDPALSSSAYTARSATPTTVNLSIMTGDIEPNNSNYGGGLENLPRFLEDWNGTEFTFRGSMVQMWRSQQANGTWRYISASDPYYSAPTRNWGFDSDLEDMSKLPPGTPMVRTTARKGWTQPLVSFDS